jgi:class 3 adenylate cyclase
VALSNLHLWWLNLKVFYEELQDFLLWCGILPKDFKPERRVTPKGLGENKRTLMELGYATIQEDRKKLVESHHILDKFVGTRASHFAKQMGNKAVWEGELTKMIVLFSDVRGFTFMTGQLKTQETVRFLNRMFTELEEIITFSGGEINKFMGDAILAFFPLSKENPELSVKKALLAALQMQDAFHRQQIAFREHYSTTVEPGLGIGMAAGDVIIGNIGSARRMEFTLIGDTVNLASRLCSIASDNQVLINQNLTSIAAQNFRMQELPAVQLKGITGTHVPCVVLGEKLMGLV